MDTIDVLAASLKEAVEGKTSRLKPEEMQAALINCKSLLWKNSLKKANQKKMAKLF